MEKGQGLGTEEQLVIMAKGKRTKRLRLLSPNCGVAGATYTHSSANSEDSSSTTTYESTDQQDQDLANCLILLARGGPDSNHHDHQKQDDHDDDDDNNNNKIEKDDYDDEDGNIEKGGKSSTSTGKLVEMSTSTNTNKGGVYIYECKTCNRTFPSFQALGGHRASHKRPKLMLIEEKKPSQLQLQPQPQPQPQVIMDYDHFKEAGQAHIKPDLSISIQLESHTHKAFHVNKAKIHECSICGSEFTSGQALGGHMRRHRATNNTTQVVAAPVPALQVEVQHPKNLLEFDLNLPAPEEDLPETKFVLSASPALVGCHY